MGLPPQELCGFSLPFYASCAGSTGIVRPESFARLDRGHQPRRQVTEVVLCFASGGNVERKRSPRLTATL